jgi:hypothetical protein
LIGDRELKVLAGWLNHRSPEFRATAARVVGGYQTRARDFLPALEAAAADADRRVRQAVSEAIEQVRGGHQRGIS